VKALLLISDRDNVATALDLLEPGRRVELGDKSVVVVDQIPPGHKVALTSIAAGAAVVKYGSPIGTATCDIAPGSHVHTHNVASTRGRGDRVRPPFEEEARLAEPADERAEPPVPAERTKV
jgi:altronate dehydratase